MDAKKFLKDNGYDPNDEIHKLKSGGVTTKLFHILEAYNTHVSKDNFFCDKEERRLIPCETQCLLCTEIE